MTFRITHVDVHHRRHRLFVRNVVNVAAAMAWAEQLYGEAIYMAAIHLWGEPK